MNVILTIMPATVPGGLQCSVLIKYAIYMIIYNLF